MNKELEVLDKRTEYRLKRIEKTKEKLKEKHEEKIEKEANNGHQHSHTVRSYL